MISALRITFCISSWLQKRSYFTISNAIFKIIFLMSDSIFSKISEFICLKYSFPIYYIILLLLYHIDPYVISIFVCVQ